MFACQDVQCAALIGTCRERGVEWAVFVGRWSWSFAECVARVAPTAGFCAGCTCPIGSDSGTTLW